MDPSSWARERIQRHSSLLSYVVGLSIGQATYNAMPAYSVLTFQVFLFCVCEVGLFFFIGWQESREKQRSDDWGSSLRRTGIQIVETIIAVLLSLVVQGANAIIISGFGAAQKLMTLAILFFVFVIFDRIGVVHRSRGSTAKML